MFIIYKLIKEILVNRMWIRDQLEKDMGSMQLQLRLAQVLFASS